MLVIPEFAELAAYAGKRSDGGINFLFTTKDKTIVRRISSHHRTGAQKDKRIIDVGRTRTYAPEGN